MSPSPQPSSTRTRRVAALASIVLVLPLLAACSSAVQLKPAPKANAVGCADVIVHLPKSLESLKQRDTDSQGTAAWGSPAGVLLTCGITTPTVSDLPCYSPDGVDWLVEQTGQGGKDAIYTTYGRSPGVQVVVDTSAVPTASNVLFDLADSVRLLKRTHRCQSAS